MQAAKTSATGGGVSTATTLCCCSFLLPSVNEKAFRLQSSKPPSAALSVPGSQPSKKGLQAFEARRRLVHRQQPLLVSPLICRGRPFKQRPQSHELLESLLSFPKNAISETGFGSNMVTSNRCHLFWHARAKESCSSAGPTASGRPLEP